MGLGREITVYAAVGGKGGVEWLKQVEAAGDVGSWRGEMGEK